MKMMLYFLFYCLKKPFETAKTYYIRFKKVDKLSLFDRINYPKFWITFLEFFILAWFIFYKTIHWGFIFLYILAWLWEEYVKGKWKYEYRNKYIYNLGKLSKE